MEKTAQCACGGFRAVVSGDPLRVTICHCQACQRRSGVPWTCNAHYRTANVRLEGEFKIFVRDGQEGRKLRHHFCPNCGTTVCWIGEKFPDLIGLVVGAFADPSFPPPTVSVFEESMHKWVVLPPGMEHYKQGRPPAWTPGPPASR